MEKRVLVAYATKHGATKEIAEKIGEVLRQVSLEADVLEVDEVSDLSPYQAFVVGSAVYIGQWRSEAANFLKKNQETLSGNALWLFSSGPTGEGDPTELLHDWNFPDKLKPLADELQPRDIAVFHGVLDMNELNLLERTIVNGVKSPVGDFRDWEAITAWAMTIANALNEIS